MASRSWRAAWMSLRTLGAVKTGIKASRLPTLQRIDTPDLSRGAQLQQAQFREKRALAQKFGVEANLRLRLQGACQRFKLLASIDPNRVRHCLTTCTICNEVDLITMLLLAKAFLDIALRRQTPAYLPASLLLLVLAAVCRGADGSAGRAAAPAAQRPDSAAHRIGSRHAAGVYLGLVGARAPPRALSADRDRAAGRRSPRVY